MEEDQWHLLYYDSMSSVSEKFTKRMVNVALLAVSVWVNILIPRPALSTVLFIGVDPELLSLELGAQLV